MENPTLKELLLNLEKKMRQLQIAEEKTKKSKGTLIHHPYNVWAVEQHQKSVEHYKKKIEEFGGGVIVEVSGLAWDEMDTKLMLPKRFTMYLNCKDADEAKLLLETELAQVPDLPFIWESLEFRTIKLKHLNFTQ